MVRWREDGGDPSDLPIREEALLQYHSIVCKLMPGPSGAVMKKLNAMHEDILESVKITSIAWPGIATNDPVEVCYELGAMLEASREETAKLSLEALTLPVHEYVPGVQYCGNCGKQLQDIGPVDKLVCYCKHAHEQGIT